MPAVFRSMPEPFQAPGYTLRVYSSELTLILPLSAPVIRNGGTSA